VKNILKNTLAILDKKEKKRFVILIILDIIISTIDILSLVVLLWIIQFYIQPVAANRLSFLPAWLIDKNSIVFIAIFFFLFGIKNMAAWLISRGWYKFIGDVAVRISRNNLVKYQRADFEEFVNVDSAVHIRKIGFQPFEFCQYILSGIPQIITQSFLILLAIIAIILFNAKLFLLLLGMLLPPVIGIFYFIKNRLGKVRKDIRSSNERSFQYMLDALKGYVESNIYNRNDFFLRRFINARQKFSTSLFESISIQNMPPRIIEVFAVLGLFILIAIAKWSGNDNTDYLVTIGAFMAAAYKIIPGIVKIINTSGQIRAYEFSIGDLAANDQEIKSNDEKITPAAIHSLQLKGVSFQYDQHAVLNDFSFSINKGDFLGISGESGKGKTTILNLLLGFLDPAKGEIIINDVQVDKAGITRYWPFIAYARQQSFFIHDTILRNITLEEDGYNAENLHYALKVSGLDKLVAGSSEGLEKIITENGKNISGGQQQRVALARALYKKAELILLDEPFNELDEASSILLLEHFRGLAKQGNIVIMITHDSKSLSYCNKIISLDEQG
jgi:ABC-type multidrug transport system fused ATPase/permease subunit